MISKIIPAKIPLGFKVLGFGWTPVGTPTLHLIINSLGDHEFFKRETWFDSHGDEVAPEEACFLQEIWEGETKKMGFAP